MKVKGHDIVVGVESVLVEEDYTTCVMGHVEPTCKNVMIDIFGRLLRGNDMPPACNLSRKHLLFTDGAEG